MEEFIAKENIRRFEAQLAACKDEEQREVLRQLLDAERKRLARMKTNLSPPTAERS